MSDKAELPDAAPPPVIVLVRPQLGENIGKAARAMLDHAGLPVVSFDDARMELGLRHGENEGAAAHRAVDKARSLLRARQPFEAAEAGRSDGSLRTLGARRGT